MPRSSSCPWFIRSCARLAAQKLAQEKPGQTLEATALVHEAYLRLVGAGDDPHWDNRRHFFAAAAEAMRRILIENARRKQSRKHGGDWQRCDVDTGALVAPEPNVDLLALDAALHRLAQHEPLNAKLVELRYFAGLTGDQAAAVLGISTSRRIGTGCTPVPGFAVSLALARNRNVRFPRPPRGFFWCHQRILSHRRVEAKRSASEVRHERRSDFPPGIGPEPPRGARRVS